MNANPELVELEKKPDLPKGCIRVFFKDTEGVAINLLCRLHHEAPTQDGLEIVKLVQKLIEPTGCRKLEREFMAKLLTHYDENHLQSPKTATDEQLRKDAKLHPRGAISLNKIHDADDISKVDPVSYYAPNAGYAKWIYTIHLEFKFVEVRRRGENRHGFTYFGGEEFIWAEPLGNVTDAWMRLIEDDKKGERKQRGSEMPRFPIDTYYGLELFDLVRVLEPAKKRAETDGVADADMDDAMVGAIEKFRNVFKRVDDPEASALVDRLPAVAAIKELNTKSFRMSMPGLAK